MTLAWAIIGFGLGGLVCYLADVLPTQRRLAKPVWLPFSFAKFFDYLKLPRNAAVLFLLTLLAVLLFVFPVNAFPGYQLLLVGAYFALVIVIDIEHRLVLHMVSLGGALLLGAIGLQWVGFTRVLLGGAAGFGIMLALYLLGDWLGRLLARLRGRAWQDTALGFGDVTISGVIGVLLGWPSVLSALFFGVLFAGAFSLLYLIWAMAQRSYTPMMSIAYAPFLCLGAMTTIVLAIF